MGKYKQNTASHHLLHSSINKTMQTFNLKWDLNPGLQLENNLKKEEERECPRSFPQANLYIAAALPDKQRHVNMTRKYLELFSGLLCEAVLESKHLTHSAI